ncbi:hypothetical protein HPB51_001987 [Rhipicephalus microplus]|uniref:COMM domain-containing protein n=1 Tax=Rhipicephalus microplus TaxID=6941 RepID=A0A9J6EW41_RHIMP|nr:hypothetical protein HPB51_001987 [Rhipicephalus microplus]
MVLLLQVSTVVEYVICICLCTIVQLQNVDWEVQVRTAQQSAARSKRLQALVDLVVSTGAAHDHLLLQFSHGQLFNLYTQLEQIQVQLDSLI